MYAGRFFHKGHSDSLADNYFGIVLAQQNSFVERSSHLQVIFASAADRLELHLVSQLLVFEVQIWSSLMVEVIMSRILSLESMCFIERTSRERFIKVSLRPVRKHSSRALFLPSL